jgi:hypothetical protein
MFFSLGDDISTKLRKENQAEAASHKTLFSLGPVRHRMSKPRTLVNGPIAGSASVFSRAPEYFMEVIAGRGIFSKRFVCTQSFRTLTKQFEIVTSGKEVHGKSRLAD